VVCSQQNEIKNPEMGLHFNGIKPPRHFVPPLLSLRAGGEILGVLRYAATKALAEFHLSLHHLIPSSPYRLPISGKPIKFAKWLYPILKTSNIQFFKSEEFL
jgi:hypothetical protein